MIKFENVEKRYEDGTLALSDYNIEINKGEFVCLIGPSGCGKTTTLKMINQLIPHSGGSICIEGEDITRMDPIALRRNIGYVIQEKGLMPHLTVEENIAMVPNLLKWDKSKIRDRVDELLRLVRLDPDEYRYRLPANMSGGQQQRIGVIRALATEPDIILMDEPFGALDPITREEIQNELLDIQQKLHKTIVFVTHDIAEAFKLADTVIIMNKGCIEQMGSPEEIKTSPANEFVKNFIGNQEAGKISMDTPVQSLVEEVILKVHPKEKATIVLDKMEDLGLETAQLVDDRGQWKGMVYLSYLKKAARRRDTAGSAKVVDRRIYIEKGSIRDVAGLFHGNEMPIPVLNEKEKLEGVITTAGMSRLAVKSFNI